MGLIAPGSLKGTRGEDMRATIMLAWQWAIRSFGHDHVSNLRIRSLRVAEEATELAQACKVTEEQMHQLVSIVYYRPVGNPVEEVGGVLMTTYVMCARLDRDSEDVFANELAKVLAK